MPSSVVCRSVKRALLSQGCAVFATAVEEADKLQTVMGSVSAGVSIATVTLPSSQGRALMVVRRETIQDPKFYDQFYGLVQKYAELEQKSGPPPLAEPEATGGR